MTDLIELATGKLNDPIFMDWAINRYSQMEKCHPQHRNAMEQAWFDYLTLRRWLDSDNGVKYVAVNPESKDADPLVADGFPYALF